MQPPYRRGHRFKTGRILRRIPNWATHYDATSARPQLDAFVPRAKDRGSLSAHLEELAPASAILRLLDDSERLSDFGLCGIDVASS